MSYDVTLAEKCNFFDLITSMKENFMNLGR